MSNAVVDLNEVLKLESLISWLESQPPETEYIYISPTCCLLARYLTSCGLTDVSVGHVYFRHGTVPKRTKINLPEDMALTSLVYPPGTFADGEAPTRTYGNALVRAKELLSPVSPD